MKNLNPLKIGKYTLGITFGLANIFLFGFIISALCAHIDLAGSFAIGGLFYLYIAFWTNIVIFLFLQIYGCCYREKLKQSFIGAAILLINIPIAIFYVFFGICLVEYFNIK